jgi:hypothetical protein
MRKWLKSRHRFIYFYLAVKYLRFPKDVYYIAHGIDQLDPTGKITRSLIKFKVMVKEEEGKRVKGKYNE